MSLLRMQRHTRLRAGLCLPLIASPSACRSRSVEDLEPDGGPSANDSSALSAAARCALCRPRLTLSRASENYQPLAPLRHIVGFQKLPPPGPMPTIRKFRSISAGVSIGLLTR